MAKLTKPLLSILVVNQLGFKIKGCASCFCIVTLYCMVQMYVEMGTSGRLPDAAKLMKMAPCRRDYRHTCLSAGYIFSLDKDQNISLSHMQEYSTIINQYWHSIYVQQSLMVSNHKQVKKQGWCAAKKWVDQQCLAQDF
jgi:hypothetical protein